MLYNDLQQLQQDEELRSRILTSLFNKAAQYLNATNTFDWKEERKKWASNLHNNYDGVLNAATWYYISTAYIDESEPEDTNFIKKAEDSAIQDYINTFVDKFTDALFRPIPNR